jgi:acetyltransferase-like isoleucine patch superfamily enzyme
MARLSKLIDMARARWVLRGHKVGRRVKVERGTRLDLNGIVELGDRVLISTDVGIGLNGSSPVLCIGSGTYLQPRTRINVRERVEIGAYCAISWDVDILDTDFHGIVEMDGSTSSISTPVIIQDRVWIGAGAKVLKGVTIGHDSVIAAGAVVTKSFPPHSLIAGVPARRIKEIRGWTP